MAERNKTRLWLYIATYQRLTEVQQRMNDARPPGSRVLTLDEVVERLLDIAAEREEAGA